MKTEEHKIISIITPSLNQGKFIEQTITSVLEQTGNFYIDYIIADAGSKDATVDIIKKYEDLLKSNNYEINCRGIEFRWWSRPDNGQSQAINNGFAIAKGSIFAWLNSDDFYYDKNVFSKIMENFNSHPDVDLVYGNGRIVDENGREKQITELIDVNYEILLRRGCNIFQPSSFFTKKIFYEVGCLDETMHFAMDYDLWIRITKKSKCLKLDDIISNFREWENSKTVSLSKKFIEEEKLIYKKYGGNIINTRTIHKIRDKLTVLDALKKIFPKNYGRGKKIFYFLIDHLRYKKIL